MAKGKTAEKSADTVISSGMKARLKNYRQAPRKVQLVASFVRGKNVSRALVELAHLNKRAAKSFKKLIESAAANAKEVRGLNHEQLIIKEARVDKGFTFTRFRPRSRGRAAPIRKRTSRISIVLGTIEENQESGIKNQKEVAPQKTSKAVKTKSS